MVVESFDLDGLSDEALSELHNFDQVLHAESAPDDPRRPLDDYLAAVRSIPRFIESHVLLARDDAGGVAGKAECVILRTGENPHLAQLDMAVRPDMRRRGIGRALLESAADFAAADGRTLLIGVTTDRVPAGEEFAKRVGAEAANRSHVNRLDLPTIDRALVDDWISTGPVRAPDYSLLSVVGPLPDDLVGEVASLLDVMNEAPGGNLNLEDRATPVAHLREQEEQVAATGRMWRWIFARHNPSGRLVGLTEATWSPSSPARVQQGNTGVVREHRGHALGKWMKAAMLRWILEERDECVEFLTNNADSNAAMVSINTQLGFQHHIAQTTWRVSLSSVRAYSGSADPKS
ncbi:MAG TPA: GNAT family N-acetyltransferase [Actinomycetota bacterium]|nr:GNAT family N-acetyltransferase [Actinomycetota bacterium]